MVKLYALLLLIASSNFIFTQLNQIPDLDGNYQNNFIPNYIGNSNRAAFTQAANFPDSLSSFTYGLPKAGAIFGNMDSDTDLEIIYGVGTTLYAKNIDATDVPGWPKTFPANYEVIWAPAMGDIDGDSIDEIVVTAGGQVGGNIYAYEQDGSLISGFPITLGKFPLMPVLSDLDSNGAMEIIIGKYISSTAGEIHVYEGNGTFLSGWPKAIDAYPGSSVAVGDINNDGVKDIVAESRNKIWVWDKNGTSHTGFPFDFDSTDYIITSYSAPILVDIDNNGSKEIIFGAHNPGGIVYVLKNDGTLYTGWPRTTPNWIYGAPIAADIDHDNLMEIIIADQAASPTPSNYIFIFEDNGITKDSIGPIFAVNNQVTVADIDNDSEYEFMVDVNNQTGTSGSYMAYDDDFSPMTDWPISTMGNTYFSQLLIGDLNGNGNFDLVGCGVDLNTNFLFLNYWNSTNPTNSMVINPVYQLNNQHTGYYENEVFTGYVGINKINQPKTISIYPNPTNGLLTVSLTDNPIKIEVFNLDGKLILSQPSTSLKTLLNLEKVKKGSYLLKATFKDKSIATKRFIKQ